jgi:hypothetical protein
LQLPALSRDQRILQLHHRILILVCDYKEAITLPLHAGTKVGMGESGYRYGSHRSKQTLFH